MLSNNNSRYAEKRQDRKGGIPVCPILSMGTDHERLCVQDNCAWYIKNYKVCSAYMLGYNAAFEMKLHQQQPQHPQPQQPHPQQVRPQQQQPRPPMR